MKVVVISGSPRSNSKTQHMMRFAYERAVERNGGATFINLADGGIDYFRGYDVEYSETTKQAAKDITAADVWLIGVPIYNSFFSAAFKNLFEFVSYKETAGKAAGLAIMAAGDIGFTDVQTLTTQLMSYFRVITNPKAVYMKSDMIDGTEVSDLGARERLTEMVDGTLDLASKIR
ncbi:NADH-dependent FMN reductase [Cenarchaeum symbiosum A]|uniref:NADH-dependent FMN reductase n=1 Tax=Cenarchaeum symbiosum (strain A) TaxID=414004 RepID=A0RXW1_CENSY|nr:NADH-dependent FMN reductase [Cenarchaeum symbiosum A]